MFKIKLLLVLSVISLALAGCSGQNLKSSVKIDNVELKVTRANICTQLLAWEKLVFRSIKLDWWNNLTKNWYHRICQNNL